MQGCREVVHANIRVVLCKCTYTEVSFDNPTSRLLYSILITPPDRGEEYSDERVCLSEGVFAWAPPGRGNGGHLTPPGFRHKIFPILLPLHLE